MPNLLNADASFSSKQELLDLHDGPIGGNLDTPSPVESQHDDSSTDSSAGSPTADGLEGRGNIGAPTGRGYGDKTEPPYGIKFVPTESEHLCGWGPLYTTGDSGFQHPTVGAVLPLRGLLPPGDDR